MKVFVLALSLLLTSAAFADLSPEHDAHQSVKPVAGTASDENVPGETVAGERQLMPSDVLIAASQHFPDIVKALAQREGAAGALLSAQGAFDVVFNSKGFDRTRGYYDGAVLSGELRRPLQSMGGELFASYSISDGSFPIYEDQYYTNEAGAVKLGILFSLLRDNAIDDRRYRVNDARLNLQQADLTVLLTRIGVQHSALKAYWRWVAAGQKVQVFERLLSMAEARQVGLVTQVERGLTADIYLVENKQNITRRKTLLTIARRDFQVASNDLGFYYRGADGLPKRLDRNQLPAAIPTGDPADIDYRRAFNDPDRIARLMATHPQLQWLERARQRSEQRLALAENSALPDLDFSLGMRQPFGDVALGGPSRDEPEAVVGFSFSVPLERRQAKGDIAQAKAKLSGLSADRRRVQDQLKIELQNILQTLDAAQAVADLATLETVQLETLRAAEQRRFEQGASDFFVVNMREEALANAEVRLADALGQRQMALANLAAAAIDTERLYLNEAR